MFIFTPNLKEKMNWTGIKDYKEAFAIIINRTGITNLELVIEEDLTSSKADVFATASP